MSSVFFVVYDEIELMLKLNRGFTLVELMMVIMVTAILLALAVPNFKRQIANNRSSTLSSDLVGALTLAKVEAIKRGTRVSICPSSDGTSCLSSAAGNWTKGWLVFVDKATSDSASSVTIDSTTTIIRYWNDMVVNANITAVNSNSTPAAIGFVRFSGTGALARVDSYNRVFTTYATSCKGNYQNTITVGLGGMIASVPSACP